MNFGKLGVEGWSKGAQEAACGSLPSKGSLRKEGAPVSLSQKHGFHVQEPNDGSPDFEKPGHKMGSQQ